MTNTSDHFAVKNYAVCYFDILGQRDGVLLKVREAKELAGIQQEIDQVSQGIVNFNNSIFNGKMLLEQSPAELCRMIGMTDVDIKTILPFIKKLTFGIQQFSDTTIFYVSTDNRLGLGIFASWCLFLSAYYLQLVSTGLLIRGGIAIGKGWEIAPNCLYGPIIEDVYKLETNVAEFPRIVMSAMTYQTFAELDELDTIDIRQQEEPTIPLGLKCHDLFNQDFDGVYVLDYLSVQTIKALVEWKVPMKQIITMLEVGLGYINEASNAARAKVLIDVSKANIARKIALLKSYWIQRMDKILEWQKLNNGQNNPDNESRKGDND